MEEQLSGPTATTEYGLLDEMPYNTALALAGDPLA